MLCIIPFEEQTCRLNGLSATYVGHPLLEDAIMLNLVGTQWSILCSTLTCKALILEAILSILYIQCMVGINRKIVDAWWQ